MKEERSSFDPELDRLLSGLVDETLSSDEEKRLADRLKTDSEARRQYLEYVALDGSLSWDYAEAAMDDEPKVLSMNQETSRRSVLIKWTGIAAAFVAVSALLFIERPPSPFLVVEFADGASFRQADATTMIIVPGQKLPAGTLMIDSPSGSAELRYPDGTLVTVGGESEVTFSQQDVGKLLDVGAGQLTASVSPQPENRPMRIRTATAEVEVLGTVLSVAAASDVTDLSVEEGRVRLRRLSDGESVEVPANHETVATLESGQQLDVRESQVPGTNWNMSPGDVTKADRRTDENGQSIYGAVPYTAGRTRDGRPVVRYGVSFNGDFARMTPHSVLKLRYRSENGPVIFLSTGNSKGRFGGNFERDLDRSEFPPDAEGWREAIIHVSEFTPLAAFADRGFELERNEVRKVLISGSDDSGLEIASVSIRESLEN